MKCTRSIAGNKNVYIYFHINLCVCIQTQLAKCLITISSHFKMTLSFDLLKLLRGQKVTKVISQIARDKHFYFNLFLIGFKSGLSKDTVHISDISKHQNKKMITILFWRFPPPKTLWMTLTLSYEILLLYCTLMELCQRSDPRVFLQWYEHIRFWVFNYNVLLLV